MLRQGVIWLVVGLLAVGLGVSLEFAFSYRVGLLALLIGLYGEVSTVVGIAMIVIVLRHKKSSHEN